MSGRHGGGDAITTADFMCPPCLLGDHHCLDLFTLETFGLVACGCEVCEGL